MFVYWAMILSIVGMYTMYLTYLGVSKQEISTVVTLYSISSLLGQVCIGYLVDKFGHIRRIMFCFLSVGILIGAFIAFSTTHWIIYVLLCIWGFCIVGTIPLSEAWIINTLSAYNEQRNFGKIRGFGSIGYGFSGVFLGSLLQIFGWRVYPLYIIAAVMLCMTTLFYLTGPKASENKVEKDVLHKSKSDSSFKEVLIEIFKIKPLFVMIGIVFLYFFTVKGVYSYLGVLLSDYGGGPLGLGFTYFFDASPEIITFFLSARLLKKYKTKNLIIAGVILQIIRFVVIIIFKNAIAVILMGSLSGFAFGLVATSYKTYIYELAPEKYKTSCMSIAETIIGLSGIVSAPIFGFMFANLGTNMTMLVGLFIYILLMLALLRDAFTSKKVGLLIRDKL